MQGPIEVTFRIALTPDSVLPIKKFFCKCFVCLMKVLYAISFIFFGLITVAALVLSAADVIFEAWKDVTKRIQYISIIAVAYMLLVSRKKLTTQRCALVSRDKKDSRKIY
jgi:hypothetical protein